MKEIGLMTRDGLIRAQVVGSQSKLNMGKDLRQQLKLNKGHRQELNHIKKAIGSKLLVEDMGQLIINQKEALQHILSMGAPLHKIKQLKLQLKT